MNKVLNNMSKINADQYTCYVLNEHLNKIIHTSTKQYLVNVHDSIGNILTVQNKTMSKPIKTNLLKMQKQIVDELHERFPMNMKTVPTPPITYAQNRQFRRGNLI
jgi:hypothetical protein